MHYENRNTTEFPTQSVVRTFICEPQPGAMQTGLRPTWLADARVYGNATEALQCALEYPLDASAGLAGDIEAAGAAVHLSLEDGWRQNARDELVWRFQRVLYEHIVGNAALPATRSGTFVLASAQRLIQRAASEAVARMLDELDDTNLGRLAEVNWRTLAPALEEHATYGYAKAVQFFEKSALPLYRPVAFTNAARELQALLRGNVHRGVRVVTRIQLLDGETAFEMLPLQVATTLATV